MHGLFAYLTLVAIRGNQRKGKENIRSPICDHQADRVIPSLTDGLL